MVEISKKFPTPEMLDRLANALGIETFQLFDASANAEGALLHLEKSIINKITSVVKDTIRETIIEESINKPSKKR